ncbi:hypothetical protein NESM_000233400 [Novymonas esmeraldas]|uniref:Uncharacterized protein n=1 Tax=Novymonas esmeraldas TaxID=1808958 RepID=A0AAW0F6N5_9TRYP
MTRASFTVALLLPLLLLLFVVRRDASCAHAADADAHVETITMLPPPPPSSQLSSRGGATVGPHVQAQPRLVVREMDQRDWHLLDGDQLIPVHDKERHHKRHGRDADSVPQLEGHTHPLQPVQPVTVPVGHTSPAAPLTAELEQRIRLDSLRLVIKVTEDVGSEHATTTDHGVPSRRGVPVAARPAAVDVAGADAAATVSTSTPAREQLQRRCLVANGREAEAGVVAALLEGKLDKDCLIVVADVGNEIPGQENSAKGAVAIMSLFAATFLSVFLFLF